MRFLIQKAYSSPTRPPPHRFGRIFATVTPIEVILFALFRIELLLALAWVPCPGLLFSFAGVVKVVWPLFPVVFLSGFCRVSSVSKTKGVFHTLLVKANHDTRHTSAKL